MLKLEKITFWLTLTSFAFPLATTLGSGYRIHLFEIPLWALYGLWAFRFGMRTERLRLVKFDLYFILFVIWLALSLSFTNSWPGGGNIWWFWIKCYLVGLYLRHNLYSLYSLSSVTTFLVVVLFLEPSLGIFQGITQTSIGAVQQVFGQQMEHIAMFNADALQLVRVQGTFKHCNILGNWIVMLLPLSAAKALSTTGRPRNFYRMTALVALIALVLTMSRGNWGAALFGFFVVAVATGVLDLKRVNWPRTVFALIIVGVYLISLIVTYYGEIAVFLDILYHRVEMLAGSRSSSVRFNLSLAAMELIENNPLWGVGLGKSNDLLHYTSYDILDRFRATVHNIFLIIGTEGGIMACLLFILALWQPMKHVYRIAAGRIADIDRETYLISAGLLSGYCALLFAMLWYTGMVDQSELPLILTFVNLTMEIAIPKKARRGLQRLAVETGSDSGGFEALSVSHSSLAEK